MALNGKVESSKITSITDDRYPRNLVFEWSVTQNLDNNTSTVSYALKAGGTNTSYSTDCSFIHCEVDELMGSPSTFQWYSMIEQILRYNPTYPEHMDLKSQQVIKEGSFQVQHNAEGEKTIYVTLNATLNGTGSANSQASHIPIVIDTIPRASSVSVTAAAIGENPTINITSGSSKFTHTLRYKFGDLSGTIVTKTAVTTYRDWTIPSTFYSELAEKQGTGTMYCDTYYGSTLIGTKSAEFTVNAHSTSAPSFLPTIRNTDATTLALTGDENIIIQYFNTISYDMGIGITAGATLASCSITNGGKSANTEVGTLSNVESGTFKLSATDSRGMSATENVTKTLIPYIKPTCHIKKNELNTEGEGSLTISGDLFRGSFGAQENVVTVYYRSKSSSTAYSDWQELTYSIANDSYSVDISLNNLNYQEEYTYQAKIVDKLMTVESIELTVRSMPVFDWGSDDFQFNVPVTINGDLTVTGTITSNTPAAQSYEAADKVVETGTTGIWTWRKWESGVAECWCKKSVSATISNTWGSLFTSGSLNESNVALPFIFKEVPVINVTLTNNGAGVFLMAAGSWSPPSTTQTGAFELVRGVSSTATNSYGFNYQVQGRWK